MPLSLRDAIMADAPAIARIYGREVETGVATFEEVPPQADEMAGRIGKVQTQGFPYLVAEQDGDVLGFGYVAPYHPRAAYRFTVEDTVYVDAAAQRRGVGKTLLDALIDRTEGLGCRQMIALITAENRNSVALHAKCGFRLIGTTEAVGYKFGRWLDMTYMQRPLGPGGSVMPDRAAPGAGPDRAAPGTRKQ